MSESFDLTTLAAKGSVVKFTEDEFDFMEKGGAFLPNVRFCVPTTNVVGEGKINPNRYGLFKGKDVIDLGPEIDVAVLARRPKAMDISDRDNIIAVFDTKIKDGEPTGEFKRIMDEAFVKDSGCLFGTEYLIYIGGEHQEFATLHFSSQSARYESKKMSARVGNFATLKAQTIKGKRVFQAIAVLACSDGFDLPDADKVVKQLGDFNNPKDDEVVKAPPAPAAKKAGRQV